MKAVLGAEALRRKRAVAVPRQGLSFAAHCAVRLAWRAVGGVLLERRRNGSDPSLPPARAEEYARAH